MWKPLKRNRPRLPAPQGETPPAEWRRKNTFLFGAEQVPRRLAEFDTILSGGKGTGKTTALVALMLSQITGHVESGKPFNVHCYTPKPDDFYPILRAVFEPLGISVRSTNPFLNGSWSWDGAIDLTTPPKMHELVAAAIKDDGREQNPFFKKAAQLNFRGVIQSLAATHPGMWTMRHAVKCIQSLELNQQILDRSEHTRHLLSLMAESQGATAANLHATLLAELKDLELVAALIDQTPDDRKFSLVQAANQPGIIWVWGSDPRYGSMLEPWNALQWELLGHELLIRGDIGVDTSLYIDEFPQLNGGQKLTILKKLLEFGRSSRVRSTLAIQTPAQLEAIYGEAEADTILGQCHNAMVFKHSDVKGCTYWSQRLGRMQGIEAKRGESRQQGGSRPVGSRQITRNWSSTESVSFERFDRERVTPSDIHDIPVGTYEFGMYGYAVVPLSRRIDPKTGFPEPIKWRFHMTPEWIRVHVPKVADFTPYNKNLKPESNYTLKPLEPWEYGFLGLDEPS